MTQVSEEPVLVVGAGLAGLACAVHLQRYGVPVQVLEASDRVGGRMRTEILEGFRLDQGFQVLLTAYPEVRQTLDLEALALRPFAPGALIRHDGRFVRVADPLRRPGSAIATLRSGVATFGDLWRLARLLGRLGRGEPTALLRNAASADTALDRLRSEGFSSRIIDRFFRPFFGGVFLDRELASSGVAFDFLLRMFADGDAALPAQGIAAIPEQLAARLGDGVVRTGERVTKIDSQRLRVTLERGEECAGAAVVVATEPSAASRLLPGLFAPASRPTACVYFGARSAPLLKDFLALDAEGRGPISELCVPSAVAPSYAPPGRALISATVLSPWTEADDETLLQAVRAQLDEWFGSETRHWRMLRVVRVHEALPHQTPGAAAPSARPACLGGDVYVCGDYRDLASVHGALASGRRAAEAVTRSLRGSRSLASSHG